jgi:SAM-dependent methyltransferase
VFHYFKRLLQPGGDTASPAPPAGPPAIIDVYVRAAPCAQNAVDIFENEWSSALPEVDGESLRSGHINLFDDPRICWASEQFGGLSGMRILELGPLEGGHSYQMEQLGASAIIAIEANTRAYLKTLVVKEIYGLKALRVLCGDFREFLSTDEHFDAVFASGVLYHMTDPFDLLRQMASRADRLFLWTHYYDAATITGRPELDRLFRGAESKEAFGRSFQLHRRDYLEALQWTGFCGAGNEWSFWMEREDILWVLDHLGYRDIRVQETEEDTKHLNGPSLLIAAMR